jgi:poly-gamma-glutamate capsule biosynthesis protein CapA/YwtB (metallophosphatase superfamily)
MKRNLLIACILLFLIGSCHSQEAAKKVVLVQDTSRLRIAFGGDMMGHMPIVNAAYNDSLKKYDYIPFFEYVQPYIEAVDLAFVNLEVPLAGPPYAGYPQFSSPNELAHGLKEVGFDLLITANNHALDRGQQGLEHTLEVLDSVQMPHTGTFKDSTEVKKNHPLFIEKNGIRLAFLNYTYGTNGFRVHAPNIVNYIDTANIRKDIAYSRAMRADFVIVTLHWGVEYERFPSKEQNDVGAFIRNCGADAVLGSHPHVVQTVDIWRNAKDTTCYFPVVYSVGNFVSNQRERYKDGGIVFELNLEKVTSTRLKSFSFMPVWVFKGVIHGKMAYRLIPPFMFDNAVKELQMGETDQQKCQEFYRDMREHLKNVPEGLK